MLVVISDLHFVDGTAGEHDVRTAAFQDVFLSDIVALARHAEAKEIKLLLLGDIVDLLRTKYWFNVPIDDRPWGENGLSDLEQFDPERGSETERHCRKILEDIITRNQATFELFKNFKDNFRGLPVELIYIPGNHDRLVNYYPSLRDRVGEVLGLTINESTVTTFPGENWRYRNFFAADEYGVFARHGHEFDIFNYAGGDKENDEGHLKVSFGDVVTTEIAAQLAYLLLPKVDELLKDPDEKAETRALIYDIDNIRPWTSIVGYLRAKFEKKPMMWAAVLETFAEIVSNLIRIKFARDWLRDNQPTLVSDLRRWLEGRVQSPISDAISSDLYAKAASEDYEERKKRFHFVLYGHTHSPMQVPLDYDRDFDSFYINTGTWRTRIEKTVGDAEEYVNLKTMTYAMFYREDEDCANKKPGTLSFDIWTGWESKRHSDAAS